MELKLVGLITTGEPVGKHPGISGVVFVAGTVFHVR